jgi:3-hydroxybutyryl-CoA dehydrogenase
MRRTLERVSVIGTGTLGAQIALLAAYSGFGVRVFDKRDGAFAATLEALRAYLQVKGVDPFIPWDRWEDCERGVQEVASLEQALRATELVVEAVPEDLELKRRVFKELGQKAPPEAILATNSSSIPVSQLEESSGRPERCLNLHFYMVLQGMNMVDVMGGTRTLPEVLETGVAWVRSLGCIPLTVKKEILGFCFNRVWRAIKREALYLWANGFVDLQDVDRAWMIFAGMKRGPFALMDEVGLDVIYDIEMVYFRDSGDPRDRPPAALREKIGRGELGVKSGRGFYTYPNPAYLSPDFMKPEAPSDL